MNPFFRPRVFWRAGFLSLSLLLGLLLLAPTIALAQDAPDSTDAPLGDAIIVEIVGPVSDPTATITDTTLSPREIIAQWEAMDAAAGVLDSGRLEPYSIIAVSTVEQPMQSVYLPAVGGSDEAGIAGAEAAEVWVWPNGEPYTPEEIALNKEVTRQYAEIARRDREALLAKMDEALASSASGESVDATDATVWVNRSLSGISDFTLPNNGTYINYCGPGSIRVAIDAVFPASSIPPVDDIAYWINSYPGGWYGHDGVFRKHFDPTYGTSAHGMCKYLSEFFYFQFAYRYMFTPQSSATASVLWQRVGAHVDRNYAIVTATFTGKLYGWGTRNVAHIVSVIGYQAYVTNAIYYDMRSIQYAETSAPAAGYSGPPKVWWTPLTFWEGVYNNNAQCILDPSVY